MDPAPESPAGPVSDTVVPDDKDWTWTLERPCPDCGLAAGEVPLAAIGPRLFVAAEEWAQILRSSPAVERRPEPGVWSPLEYGAHVRDVFEVFEGRLRALLEQDEPTFPNWDQDETAVRERYAEQDPEVVADQLEAAAQRTLALVGSVRAGQEDRRGLRSDGSAFTVTTLLQYFLHDVVHHLWDVTGQSDGASSLGWD
ncbi:MAG: hypothetical protein JWP61_2554 [Friedmanniella sp.]|nr:hypothetical protein [Friedmanniella sp.]